MKQDPVWRMYVCLASELRTKRPDPFGSPVTVAEIYQDLISYRKVRVKLGFEMNADYEHTLLRLLAGEQDLVRLEPREARRDLIDELRSANPNVGLFRNFAACDVWVVATDEEFLEVPLPPPSDDLPTLDQPTTRSERKAAPPLNVDLPRLDQQDTGQERTSDPSSILSDSGIWDDAIRRATMPAPEPDPVDLEAELTWYEDEESAVQSTASTPVAPDAFEPGPPDAFEPIAPDVFEPGPPDAFEPLVPDTFDEDPVDSPLSRDALDSAWKRDPVDSPADAPPAASELEAQTLDADSEADGTGGAHERFKPRRATNVRAPRPSTSDAPQAPPGAAQETQPQSEPEQSESADAEPAAAARLPTAPVETAEGTSDEMKPSEADPAIEQPELPVAELLLDEEVGDDAVVEGGIVEGTRGPEPEPLEPSMPESSAAQASIATSEQCAFCQASLPDNRSVKFCPFCGTDQSMFPCGSCSEPIEQGWLYCISCGAGVS